MATPEQFKLVRGALVALVGEDGKEPLENMREMLSAAPIPPQEKGNMIGAVDALLATLGVE